MNGLFIKTNDPDFRDFVAWCVVKYFNYSSDHIDDILSERFDDFMKSLKDDLMAFIEPVYVDKVYRDSYYTYYASKSSNNPRNCIRVSFFDDIEGKLQRGGLDFSQCEYLKESYRGFVVIRPTSSSLIGRNLIDPSIVKDNEFKICKTQICSTVGGFKVAVEAFPAASQDTETMTCAETTVWAMMEYFGNRYSEYTPLLPSTIVNILKQTTIERQLPSHGLTEDNLSYIAKCCGFGSQLYHRDCFPNFDNILSCYIESGIPIMVALSNRQYLGDKKKKGIDPKEDFLGHAVLCIGRENIKDEQIDKVSFTPLKSGVKLMDYDDIEKRFVFVDDNFSPYKMDSLTKPTERYSDWFGKGQGWEHCKIDHFVAPVYHKVYLEPLVAKEYLKSLLVSPFMSQLHNSEVTMRMFLCSTRSYVDYVNLSTMSMEMKRAVSMLTLPRFVWVAELSDKEKLKNGFATGLVLLDATECKTERHGALLISMYGGKVLFKVNHDLKKGEISMNSFDMYYNLK